ncbi:unnamed protein product [Rhodiola kirilowii]
MWVGLHLIINAVGRSRMCGGVIVLDRRPTRERYSIVYFHLVKMWNQNQLRKPL